MIAYKIKNICMQTGEVYYCTREENQNYHMVFISEKKARRYMNYWKDIVYQDNRVRIYVDMVYIDKDTHFFDRYDEDSGIIRRLKGKPKKKKKEWIDPHLGCPSYPECDEMPTGCRKIMGKDVEMFGYRD
jgi:hypothetical protein